MDFLGTIGWRTEVDPTGAQTGMGALAAEIRAAMAALDREEATVEIKGDIRDLEKDVLEAKALLNDLEKRKAAYVKSGAKSWVTRMNKEIGEQRQLIKDLTLKKDKLAQTYRHDAAHTKDVAKQAAAYAEVLKAVERLEAAEKARIREKQAAEAREHRTWLQQQLQKERYYEREAKIQEEAAANVEKLRSAYQRLRLEQTRLTSGRRRIEGFRSDAEVQRLRQVGAEMDLLRNRITAAGGTFDDLDDDVDNSNNSLSRLAATLADTRVHLGFFSLSLKGLAISLATMGPMLLSVVGAAGALVGVTGAGLVGALGAGAAGMTAFGLATFGLVQAFKPAAEEMGAATAAATAYDDAVRKYGKNSDEAKTAQKNLTTTLKNISPAAREAVRAFAGMRDEFISSTGPARRDIFGAMAMGLERLRTLTPSFANQVNGLASNLKTAGAAFLTAFDADEMERTMNTLLGNFSNVLPTLGEAFGNIAEGLANIFAEFSTHFDDIGGGLLEWSEGFVASTQNATELTSTVDGLMDSAAQLTHFLASAGRLMTAFFGIGADAGGGLMDDMTAKMDEWTQAMKEDPSGVQDFFERSVEGAKDLADVLGPLASTFLDVAKAMAPVTQGMLEVAEAFASLVNLVSGNPLGQLLMTGLGGFMAGRFLLGAGQKLFGLGKGLVSIGTGGAIAARGLNVTGTSAGRLAASSGRLSGALTRVNPSLGAAAQRATSVGGAFRGMGLRGGIATAAVVAIGAELGLFSSESKYTEEQIAAMSEALSQADAAMKDTAISARGSRGMLMELGPAFKKGGDEAKSAMMQVRDYASTMLQESRALKSSAGFLFGEEIGGEFTGVLKRSADWLSDLADASNYEQVAGNMRDAFGGDWMDEIQASLKDNGRLTGEWRDRLREAGATREQIHALAATTGDFGQAMKRAADQANAANLAILNAKRAAGGMDTLGAGMASKFGRFQDAVGRKTAMKIGVEVDDQDALRRIMRLSTIASELGGKKAVMRILAEDQGAQATISQLEGRVKRLSRPWPIMFKVNDGISATVRGITKAIDNIPDQHKTNIQGNDGLSGKAKQATASVGRIPDNHNTKITGDAGQAIAAAASAVATINSMRAVIQVVANVAGAVGQAALGARAMGGPLTGYATGGGFITKPTFITGEEAPRHPEFVIATNPRYRQANLGYLAEAASMLGVPGFKKGGVPGRYGVGAVPQERAQKEYDQANNRYQRADDKLSNLRDRKNAPPGAVDAAVRERHHAYKAKMEAKRNLAAVKSINKRIDFENAQISRDQSRMDASAARGDTAGFNDARLSQLQNIEELLGILTRAERRAKGAFKVDLQDRIAQLISSREAAERALPGSGATLTGDETRRLAEIERDQALASLTPTMMDDQAAGAALISFWESVLARLQSDPTSSAESVRDAAQNLLSARGGGSGGSGGGIQSQGDLFNQARLDLYRGFGSNVRWAEASAQSASPSSSGPSITNNFAAPPPDAHTWSQQMAFEAASLGA